MIAWCRNKKEDYILCAGKIQWFDEALANARPVRWSGVIAADIISGRNLGTTVLFFIL